MKLINASVMYTTSSKAAVLPLALPRALTGSPNKLLELTLISSGQGLSRIPQSCVCLASRVDRTARQSSTSAVQSSSARGVICLCMSIRLRKEKFGKEASCVTVRSCVCVFYLKGKHRRQSIRATVGDVGNRFEYVTRLTFRGWVGRVTHGLIANCMRGDIVRRAQWTRELLIISFNAHVIRSWPLVSLFAIFGGVKAHVHRGASK